MLNLSTIDLPPPMLDIPNMVADAADPPIYRQLMAVKPDGLSLNAWAARAGMHRSMFNAIRRHGNPTSETLDKLLDAIGVSLAQFEAADDRPVRTEVRGSGMGTKDVERAWRGAPMQKPVPLLGSAIGGGWGELEEAIELTELHLSEVLDYVVRPPSVSGDPQAYAVTIVGDSMAPRFEPGERAYVSPRAAAAIGDDVIVQLTGNGEEDVAGRVVMVLIKRLVRRTAREIELRQFNPDLTFRVPAARVAAIHKVVGRL
jgi:SOS-response transcriptional repressor LexA